MKLYEIDREIMSCLAEITDPETGEIMSVVVDSDKMDALMMERNAKIEGVACWVKNLVAEVAAMKAEEEKLMRRRKANENRIRSLKDYLAFALCGQRFNGVRADVSFRQTPSVAVDDVEKIPREYLRIKTTVDPDKIALKKALANGTVPGVHIEMTTSTIIR